jgi:hypothetical protein
MRSHAIISHVSPENQSTTSIMTYWLDLFTGRTREQFRAAGASISGFRETMEKYKRKPVAGDILLCYLTGVMRWVGALEVIERSNDRSKHLSMAPLSELSALSSHDGAGQSVSGVERSQAERQEGLSCKWR